MNANDPAMSMANGGVGNVLGQLLANVPAMSLINGGVGNAAGQPIMDNEPAMSLRNGGIGNAPGQELPPEAIKSANKVLNKYYDKHAEDLANQPGGIEVLQKLVNKHKLNENPSLVPAKSMFSPAQVTPEGDIQQSGFLGSLFGMDTPHLLKQLMDVSEINKNNRGATKYTPEELATVVSEANKKAPDGYEAAMSADQQIYYKPKDAGNDLILGMREDQFKQKMLNKMGDDLDPSKNVRNPYGVAQLGLSRAERIEGLVNQYKDLNLDRREIEELAIGLNSMLQGSNVSARTQVMSLIPKSVVGDAEKMREWLTNEPQGTKQQAFVKRMLNDVLREKQIFQGQVAKFARSKVAKYSDLLKKYPEEATDIMKSFNIDPEQYNEWKKGGFKDSTPAEVAKTLPQMEDSTAQGSDNGPIQKIGRFQVRIK